MSMNVNQIRKMGEIANWYYDEGDRCVNEFNIPGAVFWLSMGELTGDEMERNK